MRRDLIDIVCCPDDKEALELRDAKEDEHGDVLEGKLRCPECGFDFPIEEGIPNLLPKEFHVKVAGRGGKGAKAAAGRGKGASPAARKGGAAASSSAADDGGAAQDATSPAPDRQGPGDDSEE